MNAVNSKAVRIEIEYEDGYIEGAYGMDADLILESVSRAFAFCQLHGIPYRSPKLRPILGAEKHHEASKP